MSSPEADVLVIGAGVIGCTIAFELSSAGRRVRVLDGRSPGGGASQASAGVLAPYVEGHDSRPLRDLGRRSLALYESFLARVVAASGVEVAFRQAGTIETATSDADVARLARSKATADAEGVAAGWLDASAVREAEPALGSHVAGGLHIGLHAAVDVPALTRAAALAAGAWAAGLAPAGAEPVPVRPVRGQLLRLIAAPGTMHRILWGPDVYLVPWADGTVFVGATSEDVGFEERTTAAGVAGLLARATALVPGLAGATFGEARVGLRPGSPDELPFVGASAALPGLVYACGHYRNGALLAPLTASLVAGLVAGTTDDPALAALAPSRAGRL